MSPQSFRSFLQNLALSIAAATLIGGGSMVLSAHTDNAQQEVRLRQVEAGLAKVSELGDKLDQTNNNVTVLNARMEALRDEHPRDRERP